MNRHPHWLIPALTGAVLLVSAATAAEVPPAARAVREEALRANRGPQGRPLPLLAHWHRMTMPPSWQVEMIRKGHPILPWLSYHRRMKPERVVEEYGEALAALRKWKLPIVLLTGGQWEADFYLREEYRNGPPDETGATLGRDGKILKSVSPFSPVQPWRKLGAKWTDNPACRKFQELYPDPPLVFFLTNNEAKDLGAGEVEKSKRYMDKYGPGRDIDFKRKVVHAGWGERYGALVEGMKAALAAEGWRENCRIIAYNGFRQPWWDGGVPSAYDNHWQPTKKAFHVYSVQAELMNQHFMTSRVLARDPDFWIEVIYWDGDGGKAVQYEQSGIPYTPRLYAGWAEYVLWTATPRVAREWRGSAYKRDEGWWPYFATIIRAVNRVHRSELLKRFWRHGELVANPDFTNPVVHGIPEELRDESRWYRLATNLDPPKPWDIQTHLPVYALARVLGEKPKRQWLLYAHAPMGKDREGVEITIPGYGAVTVDVPVEGGFYHVTEADGAVRAVEGARNPAVEADNAPPVAREDEYAIAGGEALTTTRMRFSGVPGVLRNDTDAEGDPLTARLHEGPSHGKLVFRPEGTFTYTPAKGFDGVDTFTYAACDPAGESEPTPVTVRVTRDLPRILDDTGEGFADTARWGTTDGVGGVGGDIAYFPAGRLGGSSAAWTFTDLPDGEYDVFATWAVFSYHRPDKVPMEVFDGRTSRAKVHVNQEAEPDGETVEGRPWKKLARVRVASGTLKVVLPAKAKGRWVVADAVRVVPAGGGEARVIDNGDAGFRGEQNWLLHDEGFGGGARYIRGTRKPDREATASWTFDGVEPGVYELLATWPAGVSRTSVRYNIFDGKAAKARIRVDQGRQPADLLAKGTLWASLGEFVIANGSVRVVLSNVGSKANVMADALALLPRGGRAGVILDDADETFAAGLHTKKLSHGYGKGGQRFFSKHVREDTPPAVWKLPNLPPGRYRLLATWFDYQTHCPEATYRLAAGEKTLLTGTVDQTAPPAGRRFEGVRWQALGEVRHAGGPVAVYVNAGANTESHVVADAVRLQAIDE